MKSRMIDRSRIAQKMWTVSWTDKYGGTNSRTYREKRSASVRFVKLTLMEFINVTMKAEWYRPTNRTVR